MWAFTFKLGPFVLMLGAARSAKVNAIVEARAGDRTLRWPQSR